MCIFDASHDLFVAVACVRVGGQRPTLSYSHSHANAWCFNHFCVVRILWPICTPSSNAAHCNQQWFTHMRSMRSIEMARESHRTRDFVVAVFVICTILIVHIIFCFRLLVLRATCYDSSDKITLKMFFCGFFLLHLQILNKYLHKLVNSECVFSLLFILLNRFFSSLFSSRGFRIFFTAANTFTHILLLHAPKHTLTLLSRPIALTRPHSFHPKYYLIGLLIILFCLFLLFWVFVFIRLLHSSLNLFSFKVLVLYIVYK